MAADHRNYTLTEAAAATGMSRVTIRRYLDAGRFPQAFRAPSVTGAPPAWLVPAGDLQRAGLDIDDDAARTKPKPTRTAAPSPQPDIGIRLAVAEALATERAQTVARLEASISELQKLLAEAIAGQVP